ncbi:MAG TPA: alpha/beta hydrolase [Pelomicrobium sp.]|nr:alpha/beta hydrolase [Pelomicrobium sp.]
MSPGPGSFHRLAYTDWGAPGSPRVAVCAHGLTRNGRDFDALARALEDDYRVICPDMPGRGRSDWLDDPERYGYPLYVADAAALLRRITHAGAASFWRRLGRWLAGRPRIAQVDWVGTSMGGIIGMMLAAQKHSPIRRLVLNDVGPVVPARALNRLGDYVGRDPHFASLDALEAYVREVYRTFGPLTDNQWRHLAAHSYRRTADGRYAPNYDPAIGRAFAKPFERDLELWPVWDAIRCPVLVLRGADSDLLTRDTVRRMQERGPGARLVEFAGIGHAPALMAADQVRPVREFLLAG